MLQSRGWGRALRDLREEAPSCLEGVGVRYGESRFRSRLHRSEFQLNAGSEHFWPACFMPDEAQASVSWTPLLQSVLLDTTFSFNVNTGSLNIDNTQ